MFTAFNEVRVATPRRASTACFRPPMAVRAWPVPSAPAAPAPRSAAAQGSGWQDIGVVTTFPFLVPLNTTTLPNGTYAVRADLCHQCRATCRAAELRVARRRRRCCGRAVGGGGGGGGCSLRPGGGWSRATPWTAWVISACPCGAAGPGPLGLAAAALSPAVGSTPRAPQGRETPSVWETSPSPRWPPSCQCCRQSPASWERTGQWRLPAHGEVPIPLGSRRYCPYAHCWDSGPGLEPVWHLTLSGTDQGGQPVRLVMDLRFPVIPNVVRTY